MVLLIIIPMKNGYFIGNIPNIFRQTHVSLIVSGCLLGSDNLFETQVASAAAKGLQAPVVGSASKVAN